MINRDKPDAVDQPANMRITVTTTTGTDTFTVTVDGHDFRVDSETGALALHIYGTPGSVFSWAPGAWLATSAVPVDDGSDQ